MKKNEFQIKKGKCHKTKKEHVSTERNKYSKNKLFEIILSFLFNFEP